MGINEKCVGILGGMGPEATVDFMSRIIHLTPARDDNDHIRCIVDNNSKVPSRIKALLEGGGEDPAPCLKDMAVRLEKWGADFLVIPCNTAHYYHAKIREAVRIPVLHMIELTAEAITRAHAEIRKVGVLASTVVVRHKLYDAAFTPFGVEIVYPDPVEQERLFSLVKSIKAGNTGEAERGVLRNISEHLAAKGAQVLAVACTELSIIVPEDGPRYVDSAQILAEEVLAVVKHGKALPSG